MLNSDSAILTIQRFKSSRGGLPDSIRSDIGTYLTSAEKQLKKVIQKFDEDWLNWSLVTQQINWKFISPESPHMAGVWERIVRSTRDDFRVILKEQPRQKVILLVIVGHIVNSHHLYIASIKPQDAEALTPNHFLGPPRIAKVPTLV